MTPDLENLSVLVIDDDGIILQLMEHVLRSMGFQDIHTIQDPETGLSLILEGENIDDRFDLIVCDWVMPNLTGIEILKSIRARKIDTRFIMLTSNVSEATVREASESDVDAYLAKPFTAEQVKRKIFAVLRQ